MRISPAKMIFATSVIGALMNPNWAQAAANRENQPKQSADEPFELCQKGIKRAGLPNRLSTVAGLSAIRRWAQAAMKYGDTYSMWHNAQGSNVKCEKFDRSDYYKCIASGKPCRAVSLDQATSQE
jgi:hypothetical protein